MNLKERLAKAMKNLAEVKAAVDAGTKTVDDLSTAIKEVEDIKSQMDAADAAQKLMDALAVKDAPADKEPKAKAKSLGENFANIVEAKANDIKEGRFSISAPAFKAASDTQTSPSSLATLNTDFDKNVVEAARTPLVIRDLFGSETISGSSLTYIVEGAIEGDADVTAEGAQKPQVHFGDPTPVTVALDKVACFVKESDEYISDYPYLASAVNGRLLYHLALKEQNKLVADLLATSGIQTGTITGAKATDIADKLLEAAMDVQNGSGFAADAIIMHPKDWYTLRVAKAEGTGEYFGGGFFGAQNVPNLWGIPVCVTTAVSMGTYIVGAFKACGSVVSKGGVGVEATNTDGNDFINNLMTIRAEERLALAVRRPAGFKKLTKSA